MQRTKQSHLSEGLLCSLQERHCKLKVTSQSHIWRLFRSHFWAEQRTFYCAPSSLGWGGPSHGSRSGGKQAHGLLGALLLLTPSSAPALHQAVQPAVSTANSHKQPGGTRPSGAEASVRNGCKYFSRAPFHADVFSHKWGDRRARSGPGY